MNWLWIILILCVIAVITHRVWFSISSRRRKAAGQTPFVRGLTSLLDGDYNSAINLLKQAVKEQPQEVEPYLRLGDVLRETGEVKRAIQIHRELTIRPGIPRRTMARVFVSLARDYAAAHRFDRASATYEHALELTPDNEKVMEELLSIYEEMGEWDKAYLLRRDISKARKVDDTHMLALYKAYIGKIHLDAKDTKRAEANLKDALKIDSECASAYLYLGDLYYMMGNIDSAISAWRRIVTLFPEIAYITFARLEKAFYEKGRFEKIVDLYNDVLERNPRDVRTIMTLANIHRKKGNLDDALRLCQMALEFDPRSRRIKQALARLHYEKGDIEKSLQAMVEAFNGFSSDEEYYYCNSCGYRSNEVLWRCPRCKAWETFV